MSRSTYFHLVDDARPEAGGTSVAMDPTPHVGDHVVCGKLTGEIVKRVFVVNESAISSLSYVRLHVRTGTQP